MTSAMMIEITTVCRDILVSAAAATTAVAAWIGLATWKKELTGRAAFETARDLIKATYGLRDALMRARSPVTLGNEFPPGYSFGAENETKKEVDAWAHVLQNRWAPVVEALRQFESCGLEAEALWGKEIRDRMEKLRRCGFDLLSAMESFLENKREGGAIFNDDRKFKKEVEDKIWGAGSNAADELSQKIDTAIQGIEQQVIPRLRGR